MCILNFYRHNPLLDVRSNKCFIVQGFCTMVSYITAALSIAHFKITVGFVLFKAHYEYVC